MSAEGTISFQDIRATLCGFLDKEFGDDPRLHELRSQTQSFAEEVFYEILGEQTTGALESYGIRPEAEITTQGITQLTNPFMFRVSGVTVVDTDSLRRAAVDTEVVRALLASETGYAGIFHDVRYLHAKRSESGGRGYDTIEDGSYLSSFPLEEVPTRNVLVTMSKFLAKRL